MKSKIIFRIATLVLPIAIAFSCSFPKEKSYKNDTSILSDKKIEKSDKLPIINNSEKNFDEQLDKLKKENIIHFSFNNYKVNAKYAENLNSLAKFLCRYPNQKIIVEGHTDNRGTIEYNMNLGQKRADSVKLYLESKGVSNQQISTISYGSNKPTEHGNKESAFAQNRRSVIIYQ